MRIMMKNQIKIYKGMKQMKTYYTEMRKERKLYKRKVNKR